MKLGLRVGPAIKELITIVSPRTFARWARDATSSIGRRKPGRPRTPEEIRQLVVQMATDSGWGTKRILGELRKLGIRKVSRSTVARILHEHGFEPGPKRGEGTWHEFVQRHLHTLWACDFFTTKVWTWSGRVEFYVFFFLHIETRHVHVVGMTQHPNRAWMAQQAHHICHFFDGQGDRRPTHIVRDRDTKFTAEFCSILEAQGSEFRVIPPRSPNMNPFAESWVAAIKRECLNHFLILGVRYLEHLIQEYLAYFHDERPHQGLGNRPPNQRRCPAEVTHLDLEEVVCRQRLGGLLRHYERRAA